MKSGGPWNLRGLRPEARAAAREAARRSGMSVGEWLNTVIRPAEDREAGPRRSARSERVEGGYGLRGARPDDRHPADSWDREPPHRQIEAETHDDERGYDRLQEQEWERHARRQPSNRGELRRRPSRDESWERGLDDEDLDRPHARRMSPRPAPEAPKEHWSENFNGEPERDPEQYYDPPIPPRERARNQPRDQNTREDQPGRHEDRLRTASSREWDEQWLEDSSAAEWDLPRERYRGSPGRAAVDESENSRSRGGEHPRTRRRPDPAPQRAWDEDWREGPRTARSDRDSERYREPSMPSRERSEDESWRNEPRRNIGKEKRPAEKSRDLQNRELDEDRFERSDLDEDEGYRERHRNLPGLAPDREPENSSWQSFPEEETDRYFGEPSAEADAETEDAERSNFDHELDRSPRRLPLFEPEEPFETIPRDGRYVRERDAAPRRDAPEPENLPPQRTRLGNREEHRRRRDTRRQRQGASDDEQWRPDADTFHDDSNRPVDPHRGEGVSLGGPYRDLDAAARKSPPPTGERHRGLSLGSADPKNDGDAVVDKAIAEITVRQRALDEAAAIEMAARLRRAEIRAAQQPRAQNGITAHEPLASLQHSAPSGAAAEASQPVTSAETAAQPTLRLHMPADISAGTGAPRDNEAALATKSEPRPLDRPPPAVVNAPALPRAEHTPAAATPAPQKAPNDALVAEITARMRALDNRAVADRNTTQWPEGRQTGAEITAPQRSLVDDVAADILAEKNERSGSTGEGAFSLQPVLSDVLNENGAPAAHEGRKNVPPPMPGSDLGSLQRQLRQLTAQIEALRPTGDLKTAIDGLRRELLEIGKRFTEALPQHALESLEFEIKALARRVDDSRESGADSALLAGIERGLAEVREALHGLTPAEGLIGFGDAIAALTQKVDAIVAKDDPAALEQLHIAISNLRHAVARVASDDALSMVAEDVRLLGARIDDLAHSVTNNPLLMQIESRIDALTTAIHASTKAGHGAPRELEKLLSALVDKLEWSQLTQTDHTALTHLEDRIAMLMQRLDASDARLGLLEGVERGLADLLVYIEQLRAGNGGTDATSGKLISATIEDQFAEIKDSERRTQDSIDAVQGTVEHVVDRLARIESDMRVQRTWGEPPELLGTQAPALSPAEEPETPALESPRGTTKAAAIEPADNRRSGARTPIDPNLPPDHPLEPGAAAGRTRRPVSPAERMAALESTASAKPPVIPDPAGGKADFIAAARRAAQAAASTSPNEKSSATPGAAISSQSKKLTERLRTLFVAAAVVAIVVGGFRVVSQMFDRGGPPPQAQTAPPRVLTEPSPGSPLPLTPSEPTKEPATPGGGASGANTTNMPKTVAVPASGAEAEQNPAAAPAPAPAAGAGAAGQSLLNTPSGFAVNSGTLPDVSDRASKNALTAWSAPDVTGSLPPPTTSRNSTAPLTVDKLPSAIGGPVLRTAAASGDPAAAYEVGVRFAEGRSVPQNNEEAARWLTVAAKKGFVPAQFRLGTFYEKGVGVKKDLSEALGLYRAAADKGHGKAMHNLAVLYAEGATGAPDYRTAAQWFRKAAEQGVTDSQYNLAILYARGVGVEQSFAEAYKWFFLAAKQGDKDAAQKRDEVAGRLDQQALAATKSAAEQWSPQPEPAEAVTVKAPDAWDVPAKGTSALKTKSHSAAKVPAPDVMKVD